MSDIELTSTPSVVQVAPATPAVATAPLQAIASMFDANTLAAVNAAPPPKAPTPTLPEIVIVGVDPQTGINKNIRGVQIQGYILEKNTGYDFLYLQQAAKAAGYNLTINDGFRTIKQQKGLYDQRHNPDGSENEYAHVHGTAAKISNHQQGIAVDIEVGMTKQDLINNKLTPQFKWMQANMAAFGFDWKEGKSVNEPWHYTHRVEQVFGTPINVGAVDVSASGEVARSSQTRGIDKFNSREVYDRGQAISRSQQMTQSSRDTHMDQSGASCIAGSTRIGCVIASYTQTNQQAGSSDQPLSDADASATSFNFETGLWGGPTPSPV